MSAFTGPLTITQMDQDWRRWIVRSVLVYEVGNLGSGRKIEVPEGFETDGASIPRPLWAVLPTWGKYSRAALVHDYLTARREAGNPHIEGMTRRACDAVFLEAMAVCRVAAPIRYLMWAAVRLFGGITFIKQLTIAD